MAAAALSLALPPCPGCAGGGEVNGLVCPECGGSKRMAPAKRRRWRVPSLLSVADKLATPAGTLVGWSRMLPSLAGASMVSLGASMIYAPAGVVIGGAFLLWIGTEIQSRSS